MSDAPAQNWDDVQNKLKDAFDKLHCDIQHNVNRAEKSSAMAALADAMVNVAARQQVEKDTARFSVKKQAPFGQG